MVAVGRCVRDGCFVWYFVGRVEILGLNDVVGLWEGLEDTDGRRDIVGLNEIVGEREGFRLAEGRRETLGLRVGF